MRQDSVEVKPTHTIYVFEAAGVKLESRSFTPAFPQDLDLLSRPVTYLTWNLASTDGKAIRWSCCSMSMAASPWTGTISR